MKKVTDVLVEGPKSRGTPTKEVHLTGGLIPCGADNQPILLSMPGSSACYLPVFSTLELLKETLGRARVSYPLIKQVENMWEFMSFIPAEIILIQDPVYTPEGRVRFTQVIR